MATFSGDGCRTTPIHGQPSRFTPCRRPDDASSRMGHRRHVEPTGTATRALRVKIDEHHHSGWRCCRARVNHLDPPDAMLRWANSSGTTRDAGPRSSSQLGARTPCDTDVRLIDEYFYDDDA